MAITAVLGRCRADAAGREYCRPSSIQIFPLRLAWAAVPSAVLPPSLLHRALPLFRCSETATGSYGGLLWVWR